MRAPTATHVAAAGKLVEVEADGAEEQRPKARRLAADLGVAVALLLVLLAVVWAGLAVLPDGDAPAADLERFDEIDLGDLAGHEATVGTTRSNLLPVVVPSDDAGRTALSIVDARSGRTTAAGPIPVDGWVTNVYPRASDRYVAMAVNVCAEQPYEDDGGDECGEGMPSGVELVVYDIGERSWSTLPLDAASNQEVTLVDVDGATATLQRPRQLQDDPDRYATVDLAGRLEAGPFSGTEPPRPNGLVDSNGHFDGWGWKASGANGWEAATTWAGARGGRPRTEVISNEGDRRFHGTGECLLIASMDRGRMEHLHRVCAS